MIELYFSTVKILAQRLTHVSAVATERERQTDRDRDRQTDRQSERQTDSKGNEQYKRQIIADYVYTICQLSDYFITIFTSR